MEDERSNIFHRLKLCTFGVELLGLIRKWKYGVGYSPGECPGPEIAEILRRCCAAQLEGRQCDLVRDPLPHWKPVEGPEQRAGVGASSTLADDHGKVVLDALEFVESCLGCAAQKGVAVVKS